jgi:anti-sigma-K factor RskA
MADGQTPIDELLGAYALDALDADERRHVEEQVRADPRARAEVEAYREVAAMLAVTGEPPPEGVWDRIAGVIDGQRRPRWSRMAIAAAAAIAAVAAAVVVTIAVGDDSRPPGVEQAYRDALADPQGRRARLSSEDGALHADAVVSASGAGFLAAEDLPALPDTETYQLWGVYGDGDVISLGVLGNRPGIEPFTAAGDVDAVVVTRERAGGVVSSTSGVLLVGELA